MCGMLSSIKRPTAISRSSSTFVYLALLVMLTSKLGLIGAGVAATAASLIPLIGMLILMYFKRPT